MDGHNISMDGTIRHARASLGTFCLSGTPHMRRKLGTNATEDKFDLTFAMKR